VARPRDVFAFFSDAGNLTKSRPMAGFKILTPPIRMGWGRRSGTARRSRIPVGGRGDHRLEPPTASWTQRQGPTGSGASTGSPAVPAAPACTTRWTSPPGWILGR
jgi:hypothetical protein